jgi:diguanylate cyclase (GGDEF)-like protein
MDEKERKSASSLFALMLIFLLASVYGALVYFLPEYFVSLSYLAIPIAGFIAVAYGFFYGMSMMLVLYIVNSILGMYFPQIETQFFSLQIGILVASLLSVFIGVLFYNKDEYDMALVEQKEQKIADLEEEIDKLAKTDDLTGLFRKELFNKVGEREWSRLKRTKLPISIVFCNIDNFKLYNLTYGEKQGDKTLKQFASILQASVLRPADLLFRYSGDTFMILLPDTDLFGSSKVASNIRQNTKEAFIEFEGLSHGRMTVSLSAVSAIPDDSIEFGHMEEVAISICDKIKNIGGDDIIAEQL